MDRDISPVYEARYGWDRKTIRLVACCAAFTAVLFLPGMPLPARILGLPLFGGGGLFMAYMTLSRKVAFRVDETGVLLGGNPARYKATTTHVPWDDITGLVLWRQTVGLASLPYVGVSRREGAPALPGDGPKSRAVLESLAPVPADTAMSSRAVNGWSLDKDRLITAVAHFAPGTPVRNEP
ncbi:hypothetical protein ACKI1I_40450 [Streptomyces turgidiscabies]|uniref:Uncharacterized protein n=1 Tax=Streptomyces turgidiscabies (strain Car8) TaxID=698760 RepID=L7FIB0_STRT8|nr:MULTISPECIES: hypothetical protein [Streptomyces]ELP71062.1 hypothetical protein STRTUCAR8_06562 [Streptomyces turgidiscabies Car8]MDX3493384.1 hypothetical protein [Streptomyces turgidiscabies]GAQ70690.1 hypothetical protein T45_02428 [Streptomyces turgidiscabies]